MTKKKPAKRKAPARKTAKTSKKAPTRKTKKKKEKTTGRNPNRNRPKCAEGGCMGHAVIDGKCVDHFDMEPSVNNLQERSLSRRQLAFATLWVEKLGVTTRVGEIAAEAGYSADTADSQACRLLKNVKIRQVIAQKLRDKQIRASITLDKTLHEIATLAFSTLAWFDVDADGNVTVKDGAPEDAMAAVQAIKKRILYASDGTIAEVRNEIKLWDKPASLEKLMKHLGAYFELVVKQNVTNVVAGEGASVQVIKMGDQEIKF